MVWGKPGCIVCLPYCRTTPDLPLHKTRLHMVLSSKECLKGKVRNQDAHFTVTVVSRQENKHIPTIQKLGTEGISMSVCPLSEAVQRWSEVYEQGQKITVNSPPEEEKTSCTWFCLPSTRSQSCKRSSPVQWVCLAVVIHLFSPTAVCVLGVFGWKCCHSHPSQLKLWQFQQILC